MEGQASTAIGNLSLPEMVATYPLHRQVPGPDY
jgi:hypothetical protein